MLAERQKHILLADKSDYGWMVIQEYKKNDLADDSDDEKKIIRAEARARTKQNSQKVKSRMTASRREFPKSQSVAAVSNTDVSSALRPIPTIDSQFRNQRALVKPVTVNIRDSQNLIAITEASRICHVAVTDFQ